MDQPPRPTGATGDGGETGNTGNTAGTGDAVAPPAAADPRRWKALTVISVAQFMLILDITVVTIALPELGAELRLDRTAFTWVLSAYTLLFGGLMLLGGRLADLFGARTLVLTGLTIFTLASLATGLAQNEELLIGGRVVQGIGAALLSPSALSTITRLFQGEERNKALAIWASLGGIGFAMGVLVGGVLTAGPGWRWIFFINVPVGVALLAAVPRLVSAHRPDRTDRRVDVLGTVTVTAATGSLIYGLLNAGNESWTDSGTLLPLLAAVVLYGLFVLVERTVRAPLMHLNLLARPSVAVGIFLMVVASGLTTASGFLGSQYLQHLRGQSALVTGLFFLPVAVAAAAGAISAGRVAGRLGPRPIAVVGLLLVAVGNGLLIFLDTSGNVFAGALPGFVVAGLGGGPLFVAATTSALGRVQQHEAGLVSGLTYTFHELGPAVLVAVASTIAAAGLTATPTIDGFTDAFTLFTVIAAVGALISLVFIPSAKGHTDPRSST